MYADELLEKIHKKVEKRAKLNPKIKQPISRHAPTTHDHKPWYQGKDFSPEEAEKLETTSQPLIMEVLVTAAVEEKNSHQNLHFKEDNFMNHDDDIKMDEIQPSTNQRQSRDKLETNQRQTRDKLETNQRQSRDKVESQLETTFKTRDKVETTFSSLVGLQRKVVLFIYDECNANRAATTKHLSMSYLVETLKSPVSSIKKTIQRLTQKGIISRNYVKNGRGGWVTYTIPELMFQEILISEKTRDKVETNQRQCSKFEQKLETNQRQSRDKVESQLETSLSSSSSYINNKNTTTNGNELPEEWRNINLDLLQDIGFSENHLRQLFNFNTPELVEESIKHFAFGLLNNPKTKQYPNPINVLMGVLRKGQAWVENNYKSLQEIAQEELVARKKAEAERLVKLEQEIYNAEFKIWESGLSATELKAIEFGTQYLGPLKARLKACFDKTIWPTKQNKP